MSLDSPSSSSSPPPPPPSPPVAPVAATDSSSPTTSFNNRDWFFPSQSFINSSQFSRTPARRFSSSYPKPPPSSITPPSLRTSTLSSDQHYYQQQHYYPKYAGVRRRYASFGYHQRRNNEKSTSQDDAAKASIIKSKSQDDVLEQRKEGTKTTPHDEKSFSYGRLTIRWQMVFAIAVLLTVFSSLVHKNFTLHSEVIDLQDQISKLNVRLRLCNLLDSTDTIDSSSREIHNLPSKSLKNTALLVSLMLLTIPFLFFKYIDYVSNSRRSLDSISEEVSLNKQLAYRVDVFLSVHPYAKPLALLVATLILICLGGVALFGVTDDHLADCLWLSWTYVADSGNHANSEGIGPRLVSVSISFGGMLIFAMMLGLVSDAISEKFDSLRKGRSEVVEQNHTLILGWSDKLVGQSSESFSLNNLISYVASAAN